MSTSKYITPIPNGGGKLVENEAIKVYYHKDYLGTTDFLTSDYTGKVASWTMYNEWGEITHNAVLNCDVRELDLVKNYTGYEYDEVIDLYFAKNRMYDPNNHRFTQIDPHWNPENMIYGDERSDNSMPDIAAIRQATNLYVYVTNNPVNWVDPDGRVGQSIQQFFYGKNYVQEFDSADFAVFSQKRVNGKKTYVYFGDIGCGTNIDYSEKQAVNYLIYKSIEMDIPIELSLAVAWTENRLRQWNAMGNAMWKGGGVGIMQVQKSVHPEIKTNYSDDWHSNIDEGLKILKTAYNNAYEATSYSGVGLYRSAYSLYNGGEYNKSIAKRWQDENSKWKVNDDNFITSYDIMAEKYKSIYGK